MVATTLQNPRVSASHVDSVSPALTSTTSGSCGLGVAIFAATCQNPYCSSIWSTGGPASLPLRQLIFLNRDEDIHVWCLTNSGQDPLDLMVIESRPEDGEDLD